MKLNFKRSGQGSALLLLHGLFGSLGNLGGVARALKDQFTCYQIDLRNHGASPHARAMDFQSMAADLVELVKDQSLPSAHLLGHSLGGKVAMQFALSFPMLCDRLVVADIAPVSYPPHHNPLLEGLLALDEMQLTSRQQADARLSEYVESKTIRSFLLKNLVRKQDGYFDLRLNLTAIREHYHQLTGAPDGPPFEGPALFLKGQHSRYIQDKHKDAIEALFPAAQLKIIPGAGHWLHSERPDMFNRAVGEFLTKS